MDDAIDQMHQTAKAITLFELRTFDPIMQQMGETIVQAANLTAEAVPLLSSLSSQSSRLIGLTEDITRMEERADDLYDEGLKNLFRMHGSPTRWPSSSGPRSTEISSASPMRSTTSPTKSTGS